MLLQTEGDIPLFSFCKGPARPGGEAEPDRWGDETWLLAGSSADSSHDLKMPLLAVFVSVHSSIHLSISVG